MGKPAIETVSAKSFPEVLQFLKQQRALATLKAQNEVAFERLAKVAAPYNATLTAADKVVRAARVSCGPFELYSFTERYDAKAFCEAVGRSEFARFGGIIATKETFDFDAKRFKALLEQDKVAADIAEKCLSYGPNYHAPKAILVP